MRIGYIHLDYGEWTDGSYNVQEIGLAKAFEKLGHETYIVYWLKPNDKKCFTNTNITPKIKKVYLPYKHRIVHHVIVDLDLLAQYKLDILHLQSDNLLFVPNAISYCKKKNIPHYCYIGTITSSSANPLTRYVTDLLTKTRNIKALKKTLVFAKTPAMTDILKDLGVSNAKFAPVGLDISMIPNITETKNETKKRLQLPLDKTLILCICAIRKDKHPFDIFSLSKNLNEHYHISFIGNGPLKQEFCSKLTTEKGYNRINYLGQIPNKKIHAYYDVADYVVNFNPNEIFGMAILEAMYHNCTVVAMDAPGPRCIIENNKSGFLVHSIEEMAGIIKNGRKAYGARERILNEFTWGKTAKTFLSYFPELK